MAATARARSLSRPRAIPLNQGNGFVLPRRRRRRDPLTGTDPAPPIICSARNGRGRPKSGARSGESRPGSNASPGGRAVNMATTAIGPAAGASRTQFQPYLCVDFIISLFGIFPSQTEEPNMADPFVAEIRIFPFNFAPRLAGATAALPLSQNTALFSLLGTPMAATAQNFALPDLQGRAPMHRGGRASAPRFGESGGSEAVTLLEANPLHPHSCGEQQRGGGRHTNDAVIGRQTFTCSDQHQRQPDADGVPGARAGRRRPAAQQYDAVPHLLLQHRAPGRLPAADLEQLIVDDLGRGRFGPVFFCAALLRIRSE